MVIEILISEKEFTDSSMYLAVHSLIEINNIITSSNNITLRKLNVKPYEFDKMYVDKKLVKDKFYQVIDQLNERKITSTKIYSIYLNNVHPFYDGNVRTCKMLFANNNKAKYMDKFKLYIQQCYLIVWSVEKM